MQINLNNYNLNFTLVSHNCDIDSITHKEVEDYLKNKYGYDKVCHIVSYSKFGPKTIIKDLCRIFQLDFALSNELTKMFDDNKFGVNIEDQLSNAKIVASKLKMTDLVGFIDENYSLLSEYGNKFLGLVRQSGKHASGVLVSNKYLNQSQIPVMKVGGEIVTSMQEGGDEREIAELGFCKLDILGLNAATIVGKTIKKVENRYKIKDLQNEIMKNHLDDQKVYQQFQIGNTKDIFQFGSDSMITFLKQVKPTNIQDLCAINAGWRPAVINSGATDQYIKNRNDFKSAQLKYKKISEPLQRILRDVYYVPLYQESIMFILQQVGGFSMAEADKGRKILKLLHKGNQQKTDDFFEMLAKFKQGALKSGMTEENVQWLLNIMGEYSNYSFNKSHSLCYAINGFIAMYLKVYFPLEYYSVLFQYSSNSELGFYIKEAKQKGVLIGEYKLGEVSREFEEDMQKKMVKLSSNLSKGISSSDALKIADDNAKSISDVYSLIKFITENKISKRTFQPLCRLKFFSSVYDNCKQLQMIINDSRKIKPKKDFKQQVDRIIDSYKDIKDYSQSQFNNWQIKYFEFYLSQHPFEKHVSFLKKQFPQLLDQAFSPSEVIDLKEQKTYIVMGIIGKIESKKSKKTGKEYYKITVQDSISSINVTIFDSNRISSISQGCFIITQVSKNNFGFTLLRNGLLQTL